MLSFAENMPQISKINADICIVGAGAAGITIARELIDSNLQVVLLESGSFDYDPDTQDLYNGDNVGREYFPLNATRLRYFGGSTNHWGGQSGPLDELDFAKRDWVPLSGWPLEYEELVPYYKLAQQVLEIEGPFNYSTEYWEKVIVAKALPLDPKKFISSVRQYSPPTRFGEKYRQEIINARNVNLILNANVLELNTNESANIVNSVRASSLAHNELEVKAKKVIIAAGGLENPRLLLLSNKTQKFGLGNACDQVGRYFMEHPHWQCGKIVLTNPELDMGYYDGASIRRKPGIRAAGIIMPTSSLQRKEKLLNSLFVLKPEFRETTEDKSIIDRFDGFMDHLGRTIRKKEYIDRYTYRKYFKNSKRVAYITINASTEQMPNDTSRVRLSRKRDSLGQQRLELNWQLNPADSSDLEKTLVLLAKDLGSNGIGRMQIDIKPLPGWPGGNHHIGTTRMSNDSKHGVVDSNCKVFNTDNLYIAGSSVFPTGGAVNPTFTLVALSLRLARHIKEKIV